MRWNLKRNRRIEVTVFRRRVFVGSKGLSAASAPEIELRDADANESIDPRSEEGRRLLAETIKIIHEQLTDSDRTPGER